MEQYISKSALIAEIERRKDVEVDYDESSNSFASYGDETHYFALDSIEDFINTLEVKGVEMENNGWIDCRKQMPPETHHTSDTLQGHKEWTESDSVLAWDSMYGCIVDATHNGKWVSEQRGGYSGQTVHGIIAWRPIPKCDEELLNKEQ